jgi:hypothetical protein
VNKRNNKKQFGQITTSQVNTAIAFYHYSSYLAFLLTVSHLFTHILVLNHFSIRNKAIRQQQACNAKCHRKARNNQATQQNTIRFMLQVTIIICYNYILFFMNLSLLGHVFPSESIDTDKTVSSALNGFTF